jgi:hypothetical protein
MFKAAIWEGEVFVFSRAAERFFGGGCFGSTEERQNTYQKIQARGLQQYESTVPKIMF